MNTAVDYAMKNPVKWVRQYEKTQKDEKDETPKKSEVLQEVRRSWVPAKTSRFPRARPRLSSLV